MSNGKVSLAEVYQVAHDLKGDFQRVEDKLDDRLCDIEKRVDLLENFRSSLVAIAGVMGAFTGAIATWVWKKVAGE